MEKQKTEKTSIKEFILYFLILIPVIAYDEHPIFKWLSILILASLIIYGLFIYFSVKKMNKEVFSALKNNHDINEEFFDKVKLEIADDDSLSEKEKRSIFKDIERSIEKSKKNKTEPEGGLNS